MELRAILKIQQAEQKLQMQLMELKLNQRLEQAELKQQQHSQRGVDHQSIEQLFDALSDALRKAEAGQAAAERRVDSMELRLKELQASMEQMSRSRAEERKESTKRDREQADAPKRKPSSKK